ncbi:MAG: thiamine biosynthesis protein [Patescibacteria group bacterium]|jgi:thiamine biosynthesis lipoprotein|nr:thiamine biosynthesis protein [Patescibacteria group bacterium]
MGMPITITLASGGDAKLLDEAFAIFTAVDLRFSTYKPDSEISQINAGRLKPRGYSSQMREVLAKCAAAKQATHGYFDIEHNGRLDPSGLVKGWSIQKVADFLTSQHIRDFYVDAGGDIVAAGHNSQDEPWSVGIRHPEHRDKNVKILYLSDLAVATSGTSERGEHIYNPHSPDTPTGLLSLTVVGPTIETADVLATTAFAMGAKTGLNFISAQPGYEAFAITGSLSAISTNGFARYQSKPV